MSSWSRGYGDFAMDPDLGHAAAGPVARGHGAADGRHRVARRHRRCVASPRQILRRQLERLAERGWRAFAGTELEFMVFRDTYEEAWKKAYRDLEPANLYNVDYSMLGTAADRAADPADPQRDDGGRDAGRELEGRVQLRPARDQLPLRRGARPPPTSTRSTRTAPRRSPRRRATRSPSWPSSTSARATRATSTARSSTTTARTLFAARPEDSSTASSPASSPACASMTLFFAPADQLLQALRARARSRRPRSPGARTTAPARSASSATAGRCGSRTGCPAPTSTLSRAGGDDRRRACTGSTNELALEAAVRGQRLRGRQAARARGPCTRRATCSPRARSVREAFGEEVVDHYLNRARIELEAFEADGHRLGALPGLRAAVSAAWPRDRRSAPRVERGALDGLGGGGRTLSPRTYSRAGRGGRRAGADPAARRRDRGRRPTQLLELLDALLLAGGADVEPGQLRRRAAPGDRGAPAPERDRFELALARGALERDMPVLGICRGMQMLNVALRRHARPAPPTTARRASAHAGRVRRPRGRGSSRARSRPARPAPSGRGQLAPPPGDRRARRGAGRQRLVGRRRRGRGDRDARAAASRSASSGTPRRRPQPR